MTTPTTPPTPDRLREILARHLKVCADEDFGAWREIQDMGPFERDIRALLADERRDARREERERCVVAQCDLCANYGKPDDDHVHRLVGNKYTCMASPIRALPDEEAP